MSCKFCKLSSLDARNDVDQILFESADHFALSSIGGFIPGWTLICTKNHQLNLSGSYINDSFWQFTRDVEATVSHEYGPCIIFEHGATVEGSITACGANHAHLHIVPFSGNIQSLAMTEDQSLNWEPCRPHQIEQILTKDQEYLYCANKFDGLGTNGIISILPQQRSQFFRQVLSKAVGLPQFFDYKKYPFEELSIATAQRLMAAFTTKI
jgi:ATP adenylyltransferase